MDVSIPNDNASDTKRVMHNSVPSVESKQIRALNNVRFETRKRRARRPHRVS